MNENEIEQALKAALQREPAPEGLAQRIVQLANIREASRRLGPAVIPWWRLPLLRWAAVGVTAACAVGAALEYHQQQVRGEQARQQVLLALRITGSRLRVVHQQVLKANGEEKRP